MKITKPLIVLMQKEDEDHAKKENKQNSSYNRGQGDGIFSFFRHSSQGITNADALYKSIQYNPEKPEKTLVEMMTTIKTFFAEPSRTYHHHSFTSYLADSLAEKGITTPKTAARYDQKEVVNDIQQWIDSHTSLNMKVQ